MREKLHVQNTPWFLVLVVGLGSFVRLYPALSADFPLMDGGLFYTFIQELRQNHYVLPAFSAYNHAQIPYVYPPLSFYLAGFLVDAFGWSELDVLRILPAVFSVLTIPACFLLFRAILNNQFQALLATFSFALLPTAFDFMIIGAGLPRSLAYCFSLLTLWQLHRLYTHPGRWQIITVALFASLTVLSHPTIAWFTAYSTLILFLFYGKHRSGVLSSAWAGLTTLILTAPWWGIVLARHGLAPILAGANTGFRSWTNFVMPFLFLHTNEPYLTVLAILALLGLFACLFRRWFFIPAWLGAVFVLEPRLVATYSALPMALLVAVGIDKVVMAGFRKPEEDQLTGEVGGAGQSTQFRSTLSAKIPEIMLGFLLFYAFIAAYTAAPKTALSVDHRAAMQWVERHTPDNSHFLVISGIEGSGNDLIAEWFPALTGRTSLSTPQGNEWRDGSAFAQRWFRHAELQACASQTIDCVESWAQTSGSSMDYLYLSKTSPRTKPDLLIGSLAVSSNYFQVYVNPDVIIYQHSPP